MQPTLGPGQNVRMFAAVVVVAADIKIVTIRYRASFEDRVSHEQVASGT